MQLQGGSFAEQGAKIRQQDSLCYHFDGNQEQGCRFTGIQRVQGKSLVTACQAWAAARVSFVVITAVVMQKGGVRGGVQC